MNTRRQELIAWIALAAMLFGAVSPAIAAALFADRSDILGRMLAVSAAAVKPDAPQEAAVAEADLCPHGPEGVTGHEQPSRSTHHGSSGQESHDDSEHAVHGTFCSFCLSGSSTVTLPAPAPAAWAVPVSTSVLQPLDVGQRPAARLSSTRHPRDPPVILI